MTTATVSEFRIHIGMDAVHVATAINWELDEFYTDDKQQSTAGKTNGLKIKLIK